VRLERAPRALRLGQPLGDEPEHHRVETQPDVAARHPDVLVQRRVSLDRRLLRRHDAIGQRIEAAHRNRQPFAQLARARLHRMGAWPHRMGDQPVQRPEQHRRLASLRIDRHRTAERDDVAHAFRRLMGAVQGKQSPQTPADQAHPAAGAVVQVADLLFKRRRMLVLEADVAPEAPGLDLVSALAEEPLQHEQRRLVAHEAGQQQHRMAVAARGRGEQRQRPRQQGHLQQRARLDRLEQRMGAARMAVAAGCVGPRGGGAPDCVLLARHRVGLQGGTGRRGR